MSIGRFCGFAVLVAASAIGCGGSDSLAPRDACDQTASALCERFYTCLTAAEISASGLPATEAECVSMAESDAGCAQETLMTACPGNGTYHGDQASLCVSQVSGWSCSQLRDQNFDPNTAAPACTKICS